MKYWALVLFMLLVYAVAWVVQLISDSLLGWALLLNRSADRLSGWAVRVFEKQMGGIDDL